MVRQRSGAGHEEVDTNLTSMLDLIFNVLAFFVVTFNPPKPEKNFDVSLPPPKLETEAKDQQEGELEPEIFEDLTITLGATADGQLASIAVEDAPVPGIGALAPKLKLYSQSISGATGEKLEAANIVAPENLKYEHVIAVVDSCYQANITKINFAGGGGGN